MKSEDLRGFVEEFQKNVDSADLKLTDKNKARFEKAK
jgi:hypothetical protein